MLLPLKEQISELFTKLEQEKKEREDDEKEIIRNINDNMLKKLGKRDKMIEEYKNKSNFHLKELRDEIYAKMENRFNHQNKIIDDRRININLKI